MLPDALYERAKQFAADREMSLAEVTRRGLEILLDRYAEGKPAKEWDLPIIDGGGIRVELKELKSIAADSETQRSLS